VQSFRPSGAADSSDPVRPAARPERLPDPDLEVNGKQLAYLDNAASAQMPRQVLDRLIQYQTREHANIHRAVHYLSEIATRPTRERAPRCSASSTRAKSGR